MTLDVAWSGWLDYTKNPDRSYAGLVTAITAARSVTNIVQNLRGVVDGFDDWWVKEREVLNNPEARWFVELRNRLEKQGTPGGSVRTMGGGTIDFDALERDRPEGATNMFIMDALGRSGWNIHLPDGSTTTKYITIPNFEVWSVVFAGAPNDQTLEEMFPPYFEQLRGLVEIAEQRFSTA